MKNPSFKNGIAISLVAIVLVSLGFFTDTIDDNQVTGNFVGVTGMVTAEELDTSINTIKGKTEADMHVSLSGDNLFIAYSTVYKKFYYYSFEKNDWYTRPNSIPSAEFNALPVVKTANQDGWSDGATLLARISDLVPETAQPETAQPETEQPETAQT